MCDINATRNLVQLIERLIIEKHYDGITVLLQDNKSLVTLKECITDVIQICLLYMTDDVYLENIELYACCEELLRAIALHAGQDEVLFEFLEIIETTKSESVFVSVLKALQMCLMRKGEHKARALEWSLNSIQSYLSELKYPEMLDKEYDEKQERLLEEDSQVHKILTNYITISLFYEPILKEISLDFSNERDVFKDTKITRKNVLSCFFLQLLGKPLALLDLSNRNKPTNVHSLQCARDSVESFLKLVPDPFFLLPYVERRIRWKVKFPKDGVYEIASRDIFLIEDKAPLVALGVFYYLIISEGLIPENAPKIYRKLYLFEMCLYLVDHLLQCPEGTLQYKGICLGTQLLNDLGSELLESDTLDIKIHSSFCSSLTKVLVYSNLKRNRKNGILLLKKYILQFRDDGKFFLLKNLIRITTHNGLLGYLIIVYKNLIADRLNNEDGTPLSPYFCGSEFRTLILKYICHLNNSIETDLMQNSDQIISALNIIRFFVLRDTQNRTGVWDFLEEIQEKYLKPLRSALDISRAHYKAEEFRVREGRDDDDELKGILQLSTLMGEDIPDITRERKLEMLANAMLTFDLVESLLARVNECIDTAKGP